MHIAGSLGSQAFELELEADNLLSWISKCQMQALRCLHLHSSVSQFLMELWGYKFIHIQKAYREMEFIR